MPRYNVHLEVTARVKVVGIEANDPIEAAKKAEESVDLYYLINRENPVYGVECVEWNEGLLGAIVDLVDEKTGQWDQDENHTWDLARGAGWGYLNSQDGVPHLNPIAEEPMEQLTKLIGPKHVVGNRVQNITSGREFDVIEVRFDQQQGEYIYICLTDGQHEEAHFYANEIRRI